MISLLAGRPSGWPGRRLSSTVTISVRLIRNNARAKSAPVKPVSMADSDRLRLPSPKGASGVDTVFEGIAKGLLPEIRHSSEKARTRAVQAIRRQKEEGEEEIEAEATDQLDSAPPVPMSRVFKLVKPEMRRLGIGLAAVSVSSFATMAFPTAVGRIIDAVAHPGAAEGITPLILGMSGIILVGSAAVFVRTSQLGIVSEQVARQLRKRVFHCMVHQRLRFFDENDTGRLVNRLSTDTAMVASTLTDNVARFLRASMGVVSASYFLWSLSPELTKLSFAVVPVFGVAAIGYGEYRKKLAQSLLTRLARENQVSMERLTAIRTVHSFVNEEREYSRYCAAVDASYKLARKLSIAEGFFLAGGFLVSQGTLLAVLWYGGHLMLAGGLTVGNLTSFSMYTGYMYVSVGQMSVAVSEFMKAQGASRRVFTVIDTGTLNMETGGLRLSDSYKERVVFEDVRFAYPTRPGVEVLKGLDLVLEPGETLAVAGQSGSGKSTIGLLLSRYYRATGGRVLLGGHDVNMLDHRWLRSQVAEVMQEPVLLSGTIEENIAYGKPTATMAEIREAAAAANAHDFIMSLPDGYQTQVGERGKKLSGGQRQRIAIARAYIKDARIYVLDEMTSALDSESESLIIQALERLMAKKTAIVFSHHLNVLRSADKVAVLKNGRVVQYGRPEDLLKEEGFLKRMAEEAEI